jgi:hypothetical protein
VSRFFSRVKLRKNVAVASVMLALGAGTFSWAQSGAGNGSDYGSGSYPNSYSGSNPNSTSDFNSNSNSNYASDADAPTPLLSQNDLENLVAPVALYPDALLSQVLVASTYPLEVIDAREWLQRNGSLPSRELMAAAQRENWDPSVQALVAFPGVVDRMSLDVHWTTDLGNAFLVQQADVMNAIQNLRAEARGSGQLASTPQFAVNTEVQGERSAIEIQPTDPGRMYVPNYDPNAVWGAPAQGDYPQLNYAEGNGFNSVFSTVANLAGFLPGFGGLLGPRSWGWALGWLAQTLFVNNSFFSDFGFHNAGGNFGGSSVWVHNQDHRLGVPYGHRFMAGGNGSGHGSGEGRGGDGWRNFGGSRTYSGTQPPQRASYRGIDASRRGDFQRDNRMDRERNWRSFNSDRSGGRDTGRNGGFNGNSWQSERGSQSFGPSSNLRRRVDTGSNFNGMRNAARVEPSRTLSRSWEGAPRVSSARMSPERGNYSGSSYGSGRGSPYGSSYGTSYGGSRGYSSGGSSSRRSSGHEYSSRGSSGQGSSGHHSFFSHSSSPKAPKMKAPHYAKSNGGGHFGGHSSGGHSSGHSSGGGHGGKKSHRG